MNRDDNCDNDAIVKNEWKTVVGNKYALWQKVLALYWLSYALICG